MTRTACCRFLRAGSMCMAALFAAAPIRGQGPTAGPPASLDFLAVSPDGLPVEGLTAEEVALKVDGKARAIRALRLVRVDGVGSADADPPLPAPFGSNAPDPTGSRSLLLVVDDDSFRVGAERPLREAADRFLADLPPRDRVALVTMPYGGTRVSLTTDRERVRASLAQVIGQAPAQESAADMACRTRRTLESLVGLLDGLAGGSPPVILFFSAGLVGPTDNTMRLGPGVGGGETFGMCEVRRETFQQIGDAAAAIGARVYIIQPTAIRSQVVGLEHVAGVTAGTMMHLGGSDTNALSRVARETSAHYVVEFDVEPSLRNGLAHRLELRVSRPNVSVRVRPSLTLAKAAVRQLMPRELVRQAGVFRDLPLRVGAFASAEPGTTDLRVVIVGEAGDPAAKLAAAAAGLFDERGRLSAQWTARPEELSSGMLVGALVVPAGTYRLRLAASDAAGRVGTADCELAAHLTPAGPLQLTSLALGVSRGTFVPRLQFATEPVALAQVEIYGGKAGLPVSAAFELSRSLNGPALVTVPGALGAVGDHHGATAAIPIGSLPPGDYVVRAVIGVQGQPAGRVVRTLRKVPTSSVSR